MLIGIIGKAGSGKDTIAALIARRVDSTIYHFADPLKEMALILDPIVDVGREADGSEHRCRLSHAVEIYGWTIAKQIPEVRRFLQVLGTEAVRGVIGDNTWVDLMLDQFYSSPQHNFIVPDTRFENEARAIQGTGHGVLIRVTRPNPYDLGDNAKHASETEQDTLDADFEICNDGTLEELTTKVEALIKELGLR